MSAAKNLGNGAMNKNKLVTNGRQKWNTVLYENRSTKDDTMDSKKKPKRKHQMKTKVTMHWLVYSQWLLRIYATDSNGQYVEHRETSSKKAQKSP